MEILVNDFDCNKRQDIKREIILTICPVLFSQLFYDSEHKKMLKMDEKGQGSSREDVN